LSPQEKAAALKALVEKFIQEDPELADDPLYVNLLGALGHKE
jgi:hypothetical protein